MTRLFTMFVKPSLVFVLVIASLFPLTAHAESHAINTSIHQTSSGRWVCTTNVPSGWIVTRMMPSFEFGNPCGVREAWFIEPLVGSHPRWVCTTNVPSGWIVTRMMPSFEFGNPCGVREAWFIELL